MMDLVKARFLAWWDAVVHFDRGVGIVSYDCNAAVFSERVSPCVRASLRAHRTRFRKIAWNVYDSLVLWFFLVSLYSSACYPRSRDPVHTSNMKKVATGRKFVRLVPSRDYSWKYSYSTTRLRYSPSMHCDLFWLICIRVFAVTIPGIALNKRLFDDKSLCFLGK